MMKRYLLFLLMPLLFLSGCNDNPEDNSINIFSIQDDLALGQQVMQEIESNPQEYPILDSAQYPRVYQYLYDMRNDILNTGTVFYKERFPWRIRVIENDSVLNAFAAPGGYIYIYTGLIKFLEAEDQLAGVLAHEMAHADRRHVTDQLTRQYGLQLLLDVVLGENQGAITDIAASLATLKFSRSAEEEADEYSVIYLCPTELDASGAADFFERMDNSQSPPVFLSTHPNPGDRVTDIHAKEEELNCLGEEENIASYEQFQSWLP